MGLISDRCSTFLCPRRRFKHRCTASQQAAGSSQGVCGCEKVADCNHDGHISAQGGPRGRREREFYERIQGELAVEAAARLVTCASGAVGE